MMSDIVTVLTTESAVSSTNLQISQERLSHSCGFLELKSLDGLALPAMWQRTMLWELMQERNVETLADAENCPRHRRL